MFSWQQWLRTTVVLAAVLGGLYLSPGRAAPPSGGGAVPPGTIYFTRNPPYNSNSAGVTGLWTMNTDGSGKQLVPYQSHEGARLSHLKHQGHRWFLEFRRSPTYQYQSALFAVRDDGDPEYVVLLVDESDSDLVSFRWGKSDELISIVNRSSDGVHIDAAGIAFDADGMPFLNTPFVHVVQGVESNGWINIRNHDWSPSGAQVVYQLEDNGGPASVWITDMLSGATVLFAENSWSPSWSPDGARIAYKPFDEGIRIAYPDGTGQVQVTRNSLDVEPSWSPDSKQILFNRYILRNVKGVYEQSSDILRVPATGGSVVNLTKDIDGLDLAKGWR